MLKHSSPFAFSVLNVDASLIVHKNIHNQPRLKLVWNINFTRYPRQLCVASLLWEQAMVEQDPAKLQELIKEINRLWDEKEMHD